MSSSFILTVVLTLMAGRVYAADFGDLAVKASDLNTANAAEVPSATQAHMELPEGDGCEAQSGPIRRLIGSIEAGAARGSRAEMNALFGLRRQLALGSANAPECAREMRELISRSRHIQDDIAVALLAGGGENSGVPFRGELSVQKNASFRFPEDLRTGDIMLSRGTNMMGSIAARMSETPGEYSHLGMVYRDPQTRGLFILASDAGVGAAVEPIAKFLGGRARLMVMRYQDTELAEKAALLMRARLEKTVPYDYSLDAADDSSLYCTEVAAVGFRLAGRIEVPLQMSRLPGAGRNRMYSDIGIAGRNVFFAQDLEADPRFEVMAEWTDYSRIGEMNKIDAVYGKMAQWMDRENYVFTKNILNQGIGGILSTLAGKKISDSAGGLGGLSIRNGFDFGLTLYQFVTVLRTKMAESIKDKARYHSLAELNGILESVRAEDSRRYKDAALYGPAEHDFSVNIHSYFRPGRM